MTSLPAKQSKTIVTTTQEFAIQNHVPETLFNEYKARLDALNSTQDLIIQAMDSSGAFQGQRRTHHKPIFEPAAQSPYGIKVTFNLSIDGSYTKQSSRNAFLDHSTMNLLLNSKILTDAEKRVLLDERGLLPKLPTEEESA